MVHCIALLSLDLPAFPQNAAMSLRTPPRPPDLSDAVESQCQQSAPRQGAWRRERPSPSDFFLYVALGTKSLDTPALVFTLITQQSILM